LDDDLGQFLAFLEKRVGREHLLVVLSADHGVLALPEWLDEGSSPCPVSPSRISPSQLGAALSQHLDERFGVGGGRWFIRNHLGFFFLPQTSREEEFDPIKVQHAAAEWLSAQPGVSNVVSRDEVKSGWSRTPLATLHEKSLAQGRGPDLFVESEYGCLFSDYPTGTSHGSPHDYDRRVPLVFFGAGVKAGETWSRAETIDIAPTLAKEIALPFPNDLDGEALTLGD
jgi:arylsulfatase A-like enzyme